MNWKRLELDDLLSFALSALGLMLGAALYITVVTLFAVASTDPSQNWW